VGISMWRTKPTASPRVKAIVQGKLRIQQQYRRLGLHIRACLLYYARVQWREPCVRFYFVSVASLFNYVSVRKQISHCKIWNGNNGGAQLDPMLHAILKEDRFEVDAKGAINVQVHIRDETIAEFPSTYYDSPEAREYIARNPQWRHGFDLAYFYPFDVRNVGASLVRVAQFSIRTNRVVAWLRHHGTSLLQWTTSCCRRKPN